MHIIPLGFPVVLSSSNKSWFLRICFKIITEKGRAIENSEQPLTQWDVELTFMFAGVKKSHQIFTKKRKIIRFWLFEVRQQIVLSLIACIASAQTLSYVFGWLFVYYRKTESMDLNVKDGAPLPFAYDILATALHYCNRAFVDYPKDIQDYFKQSLPKGYSWGRSLTFEDGGICIVRSDIK